ncbi:hypothetical protein [Polaribacter porphyrae]|uniref:Uncharacterized protein n=1 Tax=Polaribacter porphyrae TaxID=1137780 RepID=A0A2S7WNB0_9FLAO|nr:hypothetical protein [Polaribacter porphyrae]PQJ79098.1 hypothetical protein BTO18_07915 [Polaribacter porphyrae]
MFLFLLTEIITYAQKNNACKVIYEADKNGKTVSGNLAKLKEYVQNGNPIRVGWSLKFPNPLKKNEIIEMEHWTDAGFVTTLQGHVFVQVKSIFQQGSMIANPPGVSLVDDRANSWVGIIGTTGVMRQKFAESEKLTKMYKDMGILTRKLKKNIKNKRL